MSRKLLNKLAGAGSTLLRQWLKDNPDEPRIAWYPSSGEDFRDLLFLHPSYRTIHPSFVAEPNAPTLFLHTDYLGGPSRPLFNSSVVYQDDRTCIHVLAKEELPNLELPVHQDLVAFPNGSSATHRVVFAVLHVFSNRLGAFKCPLLYAFVENSAFCSQCLLPQRAKISHIVQVCYGHGLGGGRASPAWLPTQIERLGVETYASDGTDEIEHAYGVETTFNIFPKLRGPNPDRKSWRLIRKFRHEAWHGYDVSMFDVRPRKAC